MRVWFIQGGRSERNDFAYWIRAIFIFYWYSFSVCKRATDRRMGILRSCLILWLVAVCGNFTSTNTETPTFGATAGAEWKKDLLFCLWLGHDV